MCLSSCALHKLFIHGSVVSPPKYEVQEEVLEGEAQHVKVLIIYLQLYIDLVILQSLGVCLGVNMGGGCMCLFLGIHVSVHMHLTACSLKVVFEVLGG